MCGGILRNIFMADVSARYLRCVAEINVNPEANDPDHILIAPQFINNLSYVQASYYTPHGSVGVKWQRKNEKIFLYIEKGGAVTVEYSENIHGKNIVCIEKNDI